MNIEQVRIADLADVKVPALADLFSRFHQQVSGSFSGECHVVIANGDLSIDSDLDFRSLSTLGDHQQQIVGLWVAGDLQIDGNLLAEEGGVYFVGGNVTAQNLVNHHGQIKVNGTLAVADSIYCYEWAGFVEYGRVEARTIILDSHGFHGPSRECEVFINSDADASYDQQALSCMVIDEISSDGDLDLGQEDRYHRICDAILKTIFVPGVVSAGDDGAEISYIGPWIVEHIKAGRDIRQATGSPVDLAAMVKELASRIENKEQAPLANSPNLLLDSPAIKSTNMALELQSARAFIEADNVAELAKVLFPLDELAKAQQAGVPLEKSLSHLLQPEIKQRMVNALRYFQEHRPLLFEDSGELRALYVYNPQQLDVRGILGSGTEAVILTQQGGSFRLGQGFYLSDIEQWVREGKLPAEAFEYAKINA